MTEFALRTDFIEMDNLLKACGFVENGAEAKVLIQAGKVSVNEVVETRVRRKLRRGDVLVFEKNKVELV
jgi:ribosome-associated protein